MSLYDDLLTIVRTYVQNTSGLTVIPDDDAGPRPALPYITVGQVTSNNEVTFGERFVDDGVEKIRAHMSGVLQLDAYGQAGHEALFNVQVQRHSTAAKAYMYDKGLTFHPDGGVNDLSELVDDTIEKRWQQDYAYEYTQVVDAYEAPTPAYVFDFDSNIWDEEIDLQLPGVFAQTNGSFVTNGEIVTITTDWS